MCPQSAVGKTETQNVTGTVKRRPWVFGSFEKNPCRSQILECEPSKILIKLHCLERTWDKNPAAHWRSLGMAAKTNKDASGLQGHAPHDIVSPMTQEVTCFGAYILKVPSRCPTKTAQESQAGPKPTLARQVPHHLRLRSHHHSFGTAMSAWDG